MKYTYQYKALPSTEQKLELNVWVRTCQYWYNRQLGDRFDWWERKVCQRAELAFERFLAGDSSGNRSGKPRFKSQSRYRSLVVEGAGFDLHSCSIGGKYLYIKVPKIGLVKVRSHRHLPNGGILKQLQFIKKNDGLFVNLRLEDSSVPVCSDDIIPTWDNSLGIS